ncbi:MAG TPA: DUF1376 domain-containing protein [Methylomirabilota bacterium]|nr:DUF1376 domain-containing protein [Methylomirabilota bacterium]
MKADHWMPFYIGDYLRDTMGLSRADHGSYMLLIMAYWTNGGPLPDDADHLAEIAKVQQCEWQCVSKRLAKFFQVEAGFWRHKRVDTELAVAKERHERRSKAGKIGVEAKRQRRVSNAEPLLEQCDTQSQSQSHIDRESGAPVEPLSSFPKTEAEAKHAAAWAGCPEEFACSTWSKAMSRGGRDAKDVLIRSWQHYLRTEWSYEQNRNAKPTASPLPAGHSGPVFLGTQVKATEQLLSDVTSKLKRLEPPNPLNYENGESNKRFHEDRKKVLDARVPLVEEKARLAERLTELRRKQSEGDSNR